MPYAPQWDPQERERDVHQGRKLNKENYCAIITKNTLIM
jgi:hypothetical protein